MATVGNGPRFVVVTFTLPEESTEYEQLMQDLLVDRPGAYSRVTRSGAWTRDGQYALVIEYVVDDDAGAGGGGGGDGY